MDVSPFPYQGPLEPEQVTGRDELVADLTERVSERRVTAILGPRRYGKTSLLRRVAADFDAAGTSVIWVDLYEVTSVVDVAVRLDQALAESTGALRPAVARIAAGLDLHLGLLSVTLATRRDRPEPEAALHGRLDVLVRGALAHPTVVVFDEFSSITRVPGFAGLLRTKLQAHYQEVGLLFAGSEPSTMRALFTQRAEPFYAQADIVTVGPLSLAAVDDIVGAGFGSTDRDPGNLAALVHGFTGGHPQRTMQLADAAWRVARPGQPWSPDIWDEAVAAVRAAAASGCERLYSRFANREKDVLRILAAGGSIFGRAARLLDVSTGGAQNARRTLLDAGDIVRDGDAYRITDPVFADWIRRRFPI